MKRKDKNYGECEEMSSVLFISKINTLIFYTDCKIFFIYMPYD